MRASVLLQLQLTAATLQSYLKSQGRLPLGDKELAGFAWKIMTRQAGLSLAFQLIEWAVLACCALGAATLLGLDPLRGTAALLVIRFLVVGMSVKKSADAARHRALKATLREALDKAKPDPAAPQSLADALNDLLRKEDQKSEGKD